MAPYLATKIWERYRSDATPGLFITMIQALIINSGDALALFGLLVGNSLFIVGFDGLCSGPPPPSRSALVYRHEILQAVGGGRET